MKLNFVNPHEKNYIPISSKDSLSDIHFKLIAGGYPFGSLVLLSEGFSNKPYKGPELKGNLTIGMGINITDMDSHMRREAFKEIGFSESKINEINKAIQHKRNPNISLNINQALQLSEWYREKIAKPAAEKTFGKEFMEKLPPMRKAVVEYMFYHYGISFPDKQPNFVKKIQEENFVNLGDSPTSNRQIKYKGERVYFPNSRTGIIVDLAFKDPDSGQFFFLTAIGPKGNRLKELDKMVNEYDNLAKRTIAQLYNEDKLVVVGEKGRNNIVKISSRTHEFVERLNDEKLISVLETQGYFNKMKSKGDLISQEEIIEDLNNIIIQLGKEKKLNYEYELKSNKDNNLANLENAIEDKLFELYQKDKEVSQNENAIAKNHDKGNGFDFI